MHASSVHERQLETCAIEVLFHRHLSGSRVVFVCSRSTLDHPFDQEKTVNNNMGSFHRISKAEFNFDIHHRHHTAMKGVFLACLLVACLHAQSVLGQAPDNGVCNANVAIGGCEPNLALNGDDKCAPCGPDTVPVRGDGSVGGATDSCKPCSGDNTENAFVPLTDCGNYPRSPFCYCKPGYAWEAGINFGSPLESINWNCVACTGNQISVSSTDANGLVSSTCQDCPPGM